MNLNLIRSKNGMEDLLLSKFKNCETFIKQTHNKPEEILDIKLTKSREKNHFNPPKPIVGSWMIRLTSFEVYNSIFNIKNKQMPNSNSTQIILMSFRLKN